MFERHRPALRRQASRLLYASGHESDDVLQDVFLRVHTALRGGVVPLEPRAWLLRLVHNACVDELRRGRTRAVGDVELDGMPALAAQLPDELARRAEARALIGDIHRLPERQRHVLVMSALDGLSHEEVAGRLDTTVETTRSLLARARENLRRTAAARETACQSVCDALDEAAAGRRARLRGRPPPPVVVRGLPRATSATCARRRAACAGSRPGARGASSRSCWAAAGPRPCRRSPSARAARSSASAARSPSRRSRCTRATCRRSRPRSRCRSRPSPPRGRSAASARRADADPGRAGAAPSPATVVARVARPRQPRRRPRRRRRSSAPSQRLGARRVERSPRSEYRRDEQGHAQVPAQATRARPSATRCTSCCASSAAPAPGSPGADARADPAARSDVRDAEVHAAAAKGIAPPPPSRPEPRRRRRRPRRRHPSRPPRRRRRRRPPTATPAPVETPAPDGDRRAGRDPGRHADAGAPRPRRSSPRAPRRRGRAVRAARLTAAPPPAPAPPPPSWPARSAR